MISTAAPSSLSAASDFIEMAWSISRVSSPSTVHVFSLTLPNGGLITTRSTLLAGKSAAIASPVVGENPCA